MTESEAIKIAFNYAQELNWKWLKPVKCRFRSRLFRNAVYEIYTNADKIGMNIRVTIDAEEGTILKSSFSPR